MIGYPCNTGSVSSFNGRAVAVWATQASGYPMPVWPDGCRDLVVHTASSKPPVAVLTGLETTPRFVQLTVGTNFIGIRLPVGARLAWETHCPPRGGGDLNLQRIGRPGVNWLRALSQHPDRALELLQEVITRWVRPAESLVQDFLQALSEAPGRLPRMGTSERTLRRRIRTLTGASPGFWVQLYRARRAGRRLVATQDSISDIAFGCGYADQAHLTRDMRRWFAATPGDLRAERRLWSPLLLAPDAFAPVGLSDGPQGVNGP